MTLIIVVSLTLFLLSTNSDPDFGWHLASGQHTLTHLSPPQTDITSFTFPNYPYVYHSWLTEAGLYLSHQLFGLIGVSLFYGGITIAAFALLTHTKRMSWLKLTYLFPLLIITKTIVGSRTQVVSFLGLALVWWLSARIKPHSKLKAFITQGSVLALFPLIVLWTNSHAGFVLGLFYLTLFALTHQRQIATSWAVLVSLLTLSTLINPYGVRLHQLIVTMTTNQVSFANNADWYSLTNPATPAHLIVYLLIGLLTVLVLTSTTNRNTKLLLILTALPSLYTGRFILLWLVVLLPIVANKANKLVSKHLKPKASNVSVQVGLAASLLLFGQHTSLRLLDLWQAQKDPEFYAFTTANKFATFPYHGVEWLKANPHHDNILNNINWGGYIVWRMPGKKVFADGKMDNYFVNGQSFLKQYINLVRDTKDVDQQLQKHQINTALLSPLDPISQVLSQNPDWQVVYQDETSVVLLRRNPIL